MVNNLIKNLFLILLLTGSNHFLYAQIPNVDPGGPVIKLTGIFKLINNHPITFSCEGPSTATYAIIHFPGVDEGGLSYETSGQSDIDTCNFNFQNVQVSFFQPHSQTWTPIINVSEIFTVPNLVVPSDSGTHSCTIQINP